jgi:transposase InsO family protein
MRAGLAALGHLVSQKRVHRLMQAAGLRGRHPRAWKRTTIGGDKPVAAPDLIGRDFTAEHPGTRWCGDVTYIKTWDGWAYLATVTAVGDPPQLIACPREPAARRARPRTPRPDRSPCGSV